MNVKEIKKNSKLTDFEVIKDIVIANSIKKIKQNAKKKDKSYEHLLSEF
jgi:hypothetical protein